jgi:hypothetical protein
MYAPYKNPTDYQHTQPRRSESSHQGDCCTYTHDGTEQETTGTDRSHDDDALVDHLISGLATDMHGWPAPPPPPRSHQPL